jgi:hypothetical protein
MHPSRAKVTPLVADGSEGKCKNQYSDWYMLQLVTNNQETQESILPVPGHGFISPDRVFKIMKNK